MIYTVCEDYTKTSNHCMIKKLPFAMLPGNHFKKMLGWNSSGSRKDGRKLAFASHNSARLTYGLTAIFDLLSAKGMPGLLALSLKGNNTGEYKTTPLGFKVANKRNEKVLLVNVELSSSLFSCGLERDNIVPGITTRGLLGSQLVNRIQPPRSLT